MRSDGGDPVPTLAITRISPPRLRQKLVERRRLTDQLLDPVGLTVIISGPAGSGKSTLMAQAYRSGTNPVWLSIHSTDNDPAVLWSAVTDAIAPVIDGFGSSYRHLLRGPQPNVVKGIVPAAINELAQAEQPLTIFIDDVQLLENQECLASLETFVQQRPESITIVIAGRESPPLRLQRERLRGHLVEIRQGQLNMDAPEARTMLEALDLHLDDDQLDRLLEHTEGWVAGLRWAAMALEKEPDIDWFLSSGASPDGDIGRYLVEEVLRQQPEDQRAFMLETSVMRGLTADMCDAVRDCSDSGRRLEQLERSNAMVIGTDQGIGWYRYHHLAREVLEACLVREMPHRAVELHRRAARWCRDHGDPVEAVHHLLAVGDRIEAANTLCSSWWELVNGGRIETVVSLLSLFEDAEIRAYQPLAAAAAFAFGLGGEDERSRHFYRIANEGDFDGKPPDGSASMESSLALLRTALVFEGVTQSLVDAELAYALEPADSVWYPLAVGGLAVGRVWSGDPDGAAPYFEEILDRGGVDEVLAVYSLAELALERLAQGDNEAALSRSESACRRAHDGGLGSLLVAARAHAAAALALLTVGEPKAAMAHVEAAQLPMEKVERAMPIDAMRTRLLLADAALQLDLLDLAATCLDGAAVNRAKVGDTGVLGSQLDQLRARLDQMVADSGTGSVLAGELELSPRELELVALLPTRMTYRGIAAELHISVNTVKTHLRNIYGKLGVSTRDEAVDRGQELDLF